MLLNHSQAFASFLPSDIAPRKPAQTMPRRVELSAVKDGTMLETPTGWRRVEELSAGDQVYTLDGGFTELTGTRSHRLAPGTARMMHVPAGALNNCSDLILTAGQHVAMIEPECETLFGAPCVLVPAAAMAGFRGIHALTAFGETTATELTFDTEEIVYAQTGALLHVASGTTDPFFRTLGYGETRALLTMLNGGHLALDPIGFAPALAA
ncbi:Hint domain-containing protein [Sedimentitalea arenosa]|jgi:hypothetical protein|uniref:Hint domain-containing protein n=1 Tax=Sedimentitalea arenosa TaxID=2798803 RepID=A0A8J7J3Z6_9RHOB|nr:Hint domain-containing protein [Arenibacterium arenosum]MBJ6373300.1 Hint domain-containing protein [Arenibacterium arenosum]